jgi:hypothetical protein
MTEPRWARGSSWSLICADWRDALASTIVDAVICDPPYGARTHDSEPKRNDTFERAGAGYDPRGLVPDYAAWTPEHVAQFVECWSRRCRGWMVALTSHDLIPAWEAAYDRFDRYCFAPIPCVIRGMSVRLLGDGPSSWTVYAIVARPKRKEFMSWGTLDGAYVVPQSREAGGGRGKPAWLMNALIRDYTRKGDLVCDPFAGWGSTLAAAIANGRKAIGAEADSSTFDEAVRRLRRPQQIDLLTTQGETA